MNSRWTMTAIPALLTTLLLSAIAMPGQKVYAGAPMESYFSNVLGGVSDVNLLRRFRDEILASNESGRRLIDQFYGLLPDIALLVIKDAEIRDQTMAAAPEIVSFARASLDREMIDPRLVITVDGLIKEYLDSSASSERLMNWLSALRDNGSVVKFAEDFNLETFRIRRGDQIEQTTPHALPYHPRRLLVKFRHDLTEQVISTLLTANRLEVVKRFDEIDVYQLRIDERGTIEQMLRRLQQRSEVAYATFDHRVTIDQRFPNDLTQDLWGLNNTGQNSGTADADIDAPEAWALATGSQQIVAVIDTGVDYTHQDISANIWTNPKEIADNDVDDDGNGYIDDVHGYDFYNNDGDPMDDHDHGTHVSGTIAAVGNNGTGIVGVNWKARIMALKFLDQCGSGNVSDAIEAILYATKMGAKISNNSWGGGGFNQALYDAIRFFGQSGGLFVAAAGNDGADNDETPHYPSNYDLPNILAVAASDRNDAMADFSNYGATSVDVAAPGVDIYSTVIGDDYDTISGTSMAAPHVAGIATLIKARYPEWRFQHLRHAIVKGVDKKAAFNGQVASGGRVNAYRALTVPPLPGLRVSDVAKAEGNSGTPPLTFTVSLSPASATTVTVKYATANGSAKAGTDFTATSGTLTFTPGQTTKTVTVRLIGDTTKEANETFNLNLSAPTGGAALLDGQGLATILNDDGPVLRINDVAKAEGNSGTTPLTFTIRLSPASATTVTVKYATANGSAKAGTDYTATSGTLTFTPGQTSKTVAVKLIGDTTKEANETFALNLSAPTGGATLFDGKGLGTILNDDGPVLRINDVAKAEGNSGTTPLTFTVRLSPASATTVTVKYATANGTAKAGTDYTATSGTLTLTPGQTSKAVAVNLIGDTTKEGNEKFTLNLSAPTGGATLFDEQGLGTIIDDD